MTHRRISLFLALSTLLAVVQCVQFDLFLDTNDVETLMGLASRLYYVRGGRVNANAVRYAAEVPSSVGSVNLTWTSRAAQLEYKLLVDADRNAVKPTLNVPSEGSVLDGPTGFTVLLPCTVVSVQTVEIRVSVTVSDDWSSNDHATHVGLVFKKFCADPPPGDTTASPPYYEQSFYRHMISAASTLIAITIICCLTTSYYHRDKTRDLLIIKGFQNNEVNVFLKSTLNSSNKFNQKSLSSSKTRVKDLSECLTELSVNRQQIKLLNVELEGTFGRVYKGIYTDVNGKDEEVFVKTVTDQASKVQITVLLEEGLSLYGLNHKNILTIQAVCAEQPLTQEPLLLYPLNNNRNLKKFLQNCKTTESFSYSLTTREIIAMTLQIVSGMQYLHKSKYLHKDVAARNCLVNQELKIQITDNALSRDLFPGDYYCLGDNKNRPIKWMAVESLEQKKFSTASDVWSFGVLLWELLTFCQQPYADIDPFEISAYLQDGFRLNQPFNCPDELFTVMACCWALEPNERPTFSHLSMFFNDFNSQLEKFV